EFSGKTYITIRGIRILRWKSWVILDACTGIVIDQCSMRCASRDGITLQKGCTKCSITRNTMVGVGSILTSNNDGINPARGSKNITIDGNTILYVGHDAIYAFGYGSTAP